MIKINQLTKESRIIAYILAANIIQKKSHFDELRSMTCKAIYVITKKIPVNWSHIICHHLTHIKTKLFYDPLLTYLFIHYDIPLTHESSLPVRSKPLDLVTINKMEQASRRATTSGPTSSSAPTQEVESSKEDQEDPKRDSLLHTIICCIDVYLV